MAIRAWSGLLALSMVGGCPAPYVMDDNVVGPQGEPLVELYCPERDDCTLLARETCHGDFDDVDPRLPKALVKCRNQPWDKARAACAGDDDVVRTKAAGADSATLTVSCKPTVQVPDAGPVSFQ